MKKYHTNFRTHRGIALLTAMFLGTLMILTSIGVKDTVVTGLRGGTAVELSTQAYYAASSGLRHAMYKALQNPVGFNGTRSWTINASAGGSATAPSATWEVRGRLDSGIGDLAAWQRNGRFILPYPGSGDAGDGCSFRNAVLESGATYTDVNNPCNWGKLGVGEAVSIPLYADDPDFSDPNDVISPADMFQDAGGTPELRLKLRTDCDPAVAENDEPVGCERSRLLANPADEGADALELDRSDGVDNDTIVLWEIVGECMDGGETEVCVLQPDRYRTITTEGQPPGETPDGSRENTELTEEVINIAVRSSIDSFTIRDGARRNFLAREGIDSNDVRGSIQEFLGIGMDRGVFGAGTTIDRPVLKLSLVHSLQRENRTIASLIPYIPYLEWQIESNALFATPKSFITVTGRAGNFRQTLETALQKEAASIDFVIQN